MSDFLLELLSEEIPARMQAKAQADLARLFGEQLAAAGLKAEAVETYATPRRLALIARGLPAETEAVREELKGPRSSAPPQALEGFLRKTGLTQDQLTERDGVFFAVIEKPGQATSSVLAEAIPAIVRAFPWPKSMRWGAESISTESLRWVRPLQGIVAMLGEEIVQFEIAGIKSGAATVGHRFHHPGCITLGGAHDYVEKLRACHVIVDPEERRQIIADGAHKAAADAGLTLVEDDGLLAENAGLTEWPVPLLGAFDPAFLEVPREVIQLTLRTNQKYFVLQNPPRDGEGDQPEAGGGGTEPGTEPPPPLASGERSPSPSRGGLAPNFLCVANIDASDGGAGIIEGNRKVLAARLSDARFFWEQDVKVPLAEQGQKLSGIVFHEKLGTIADKALRIEKLAVWLIAKRLLDTPNGDRAALVEQVQTAARLAKADLVTQMVGEFPELQGVIGGYLARAQGQPDVIADAIRDHYKPAGQGDEVPADPVAVAVALADKLDTLVAFFSIGEKPTGSRDPFALRRAALGILQIVTTRGMRVPMRAVLVQAAVLAKLSAMGGLASANFPNLWVDDDGDHEITAEVGSFTYRCCGKVVVRWDAAATPKLERGKFVEEANDLADELFAFLTERLKVQQREAGVRHDLIDAVFAAGREQDIVRLLERVRALQAFVETPDGANLLAGYKRAANILKKENWNGGRRQTFFSYTPEKDEEALDSALDVAEPAAADALKREDYQGAMKVLAGLRAPVDAFFDNVTVNDADPHKRETRLILLSRLRYAVDAVADFSRIEG